MKLRFYERLALCLWLPGLAAALLVVTGAPTLLMAQNPVALGPRRWIRVALGDGP
jgi:hypothetical protein